ncbi:unnamed protein product [Acanthosepion pharaonis]|uniref:Microtubule-associated protein Jupiter n=1 Tax=Acanthosepion pharaonis TaxID=158019 RepID=A0A812CTE6_ACAPH|nr:unnamed protein product [Sepia pharaonis]
MTSTEIRQGYNESKPSSRVLKPPGGGGSNIFGPAAPSSSTQSKVNRMESNVFKEPESGPTPKTSKKEDTHNNLFGEEKTKVKKDFNPATLKGQESTHNPITGSPYGTNQDASDEKTQTKGYFQDPIANKGVAAAAEANEISHTRISQPPGGHCHKLW